MPATQSETDPPMQRRPIGARGWALVRWMTDRLVATGIGPNTVSVLGMLFGLIAGGCLAATSLLDSGNPVERALWVCGALGIVIRSLANVLDGMVAEQTGRISRVGALYNEVPDRVSDAAMLIGLGYAGGSWVIGGWAATVVALSVAYVRACCAVAGAPQDYRGPLAKPHRMYLVVFACIALALMPTGWRAWSDSVAFGGVPALVLWIVIVGGLWTAWRRLYTAATELNRQDT